MANARRKRNQVSNEDVFELALPAALNRLLSANQVQPTDVWFFTSDGQTLFITRVRQTSTTIDEPDV